jgi:IS30 family transposase
MSRESMMDRRIEYEDRCQIHALWKAGTIQAEIDNALGISQGTVSRELSRNKGNGGTAFGKLSTSRSLDRRGPGTSHAS